MHKLATIAIMTVSLTAGLSWGAEAPKPADAVRPAAADPNALDRALKGLQDKAASLRTYQVNMDYVFKQPVLESQQRRTGVLYYAKFDDRSYLRIDFQTLQQDTEKPQAYQQQYFFDGVWLWEVDYQTQSKIRRQLAEPNQPLDAFSLVSKNLPVLGFSKIEDLPKQFDIELVAEPPTQPASRPHLHLKVKPDSVYKDDYTTIDIWIDGQVGLPAEVKAVTPEEDVYEIKLIDPKVNVLLERKLFQVNAPAKFSEEVIPLKKRTPGKPPR